ncbi:EAL domain-containing protein [Vreelandella stevensii]|uniref:EAL domain-containing protein n=1 Tax=Halomonadaceae TaxID=28256 RepID=UPI0018E20B68
MLEGRAVESLHCLKSAGIRLSLDDFGTGYAGFAHLEAVPVDKLKIDRSLINRISNSHDDSPIVRCPLPLFWPSAWRSKWWPRAWKPVSSWFT